MKEQYYIEHEVKLRVMDERFKSMENVIKHIDSKFNWVVGVFIGSVIIPVILHYFKLV